MSEAVTYKTDTAPRQAFTGSMKLINGFVGRVVRSDDVVVWTSAVYSTTKAARLQANSAVGGFRSYYATNGRCWHADKVAKAETVKAARQQRRAVNGRLTAAITAGINARLKGGAFDAFPPEFTQSQRMVFQAAWNDAGELPAETPILT